MLGEVLTEKGSVFYRISAENSLLEIQLEKLQTWLPVCYERWNASLGTLVCRQLGLLRWAKLTAPSHTLLAINTFYLSGSCDYFLWLFFFFTAVERFLAMSAVLLLLMLGWDRMKAHQGMRFNPDHNLLLISCTFVTDNLKSEKVRTICWNWN